jgi:hypothetical protein
MWSKRFGIISRKLDSRELHQNAVSDTPEPNLDIGSFQSHTVAFA